MPVFMDEEPAFELSEATFDNAPDLVCFSHLRWNFVYQRPQHLMSRCARERRVFYIEEPVFETVKAPERRLEMTRCGVCVVVPVLPEEFRDAGEARIVASQKKVLDEVFEECAIRDSVLWYYTPMALPFSGHLAPLAVVYDCMDELSAFRGAPAALRDRERELLALADVVFTGGISLYEAKRNQHPNVHPFPSSIDFEHFAQARTRQEEPSDQARIPHPRLGFAGVIDERMDLELIAAIAERRPDWNLVLLGPIAKLDVSELPGLDNIHYLGMKQYDELPRYLAGWDVALLPFARNESTRYISPTKTPEYLAAGRRVVSTSIRDVVRSYGQRNLVRIADSVPDFIAAAEESLNEPESGAWLARVDAYLAQSRWGRTWGNMMRLLDAAIAARSDTGKNRSPARGAGKQSGPTCSEAYDV